MTAATKTATCEQCKASGLPLLPVRYAVIPKTVKPAMPDWASAQRVKDVQLSDEFAYALRTLRQGYLYLFYSKNARGSNRWECYTVWPDGCLHKQPATDMVIAPFASTFQCQRQGHNALSMHYLVIESPEKCGTTWIAFSDQQWSAETIAEYEQSIALRNARMQKIEPAAMASGTAQLHGAIADATALKGVLEYAPEFFPSDLAYSGKANDFTKEDGSFDARAMRKVSTRYECHLRCVQAQPTVDDMTRRGGDAKPHVLALWDAIGITHELNGYRNDAAGWIHKYGEERELQITALNAIDGTKEALKEKYQTSMSRHRDRIMNHGAFISMKRVKPHPRDWPDDAQWLPFTAEEDQRKYGPGMGYVVLPQDYIDKRIDENWGKYEKRLDTHALNHFRSQWSALLEQADAIVDARTTALVNWLESSLLIDTLEDFHRTNVEDGIMFEDAVGEAIFGMASSQAGQKKIEEWVNEAKATRDNLLWRAVALNQTEAVEDINAALQHAKDQTTPLTVAAWNIALTNLKNMQRLADTYKKASSILDGNTKAAGASGATAFGVRLKPINTRGLDRTIVTAGDAIFKAFRVDRAGDFLSEKIIQHIFTMRAYVDPMDSLRLVAAQAKEQKLANADILRRINTAKAFLQVDVPASQQAASLAEAWEGIKTKTAQAGTPAIKDARLAIIVMLIESGNFAKMLLESKGDAKATAMLTASAMSMTAAVIDIASVPAKNIWGSEAATYQKLKLFGGVLGGAASIVGGVVDSVEFARQMTKGRYALAYLYAAKALAGTASGVLTVATTFTYSAGLIYRLTGRAALAQSARAISSRALGIIGARILLMSAGAWITVVTIGLQVLIWVFTPDALEDWCDGCAFGQKEKRKNWSSKMQMDEFDKALLEVL